MYKDHIYWLRSLEIAIIFTKFYDTIMSSGTTTHVFYHDYNINIYKIKQNISKYFNVYA